MKTAISIPDEVFESAERLAQRLGLARSDLYARAVAQFIAAQDQHSITERLNAVHSESGAGDRPDAWLAAVQARALGRDAEW